MSRLQAKAAQDDHASLTVQLKAPRRLREDRNRRRGVRVLGHGLESSIQPVGEHWPIRRGEQRDDGLLGRK